jgi:hypothetical protein
MGAHFIQDNQPDDKQQNSLTDSNLERKSQMAGTNFGSHSFSKKRKQPVRKAELESSQTSQQARKNTAVPSRGKLK